MAERKKLVIIDGKSVFYRGYYAMPNLSTPDGTPTGGVFGFATMALEVIRKLKPDYVCVAWDKSKTSTTGRTKLYPKYKANRKPAPPDFYDQIPILYELLEAFDWPLYELDDYEADDIMGTLAEQARKKGIDTALITSDLDMLQVINGNVHVYALKKGLSNIELFNPESFEAKYGIRPDQFLDLKALKGDSSDNIPGVAGIGEKTALKLLKKYQTLDGVYKNLDQIEPKTAAKLRSGEPSAMLSKKLAQIWLNAPIKLNLSELKGDHIDAKELADLLAKLRFKTLAKQVPDVLKIDLSEHHTDSENLSKFSTTHVIKSDKELKSADVKRTSEIYVSSFSTGKHGKDPKWLFASFDGKKCMAIDLTSISHTAIANFLEDKKIIGFDTKKSLQVLLEIGVKDLPSVSQDVEIASFLIDSLRREESLTELARSEIDYQGRDLESVPPDEIITRFCETLAVIKTLDKHQKTQLKKLPKIAKLANEVEWPLLPILARMEHYGILLNTSHLKKFAERLEDQILDIEQQIYGHADEEFNIASPGQLSRILFEKLKLPTADIKKGKTAYSTAASELEKLRGKHDIVDLIFQYRESTKLLNTYVKTLPEMVDGNSRLHTTFSLNVAPTGRLSSEKPNLQNIPTRSELGREIKKSFEAPAGKVLISADFSQFELRLAAVLSEDKHMIDIFNRDEDIHTATAAQIYGRGPEDITKNMRREAKVVNFGVMYGLSPHGLSVSAGISYEAAKNFIDKYFELRPKLKDYIESVRQQAKEDGYVETLLGRRRPTPDVHSSNFMVREAAMRAAVNMPFQGSAADIMKLAMIKVQKELDKNPDTHMLLQIHDSLILECPEKQAEDTAKVVKEAMESAYKLPVKLTVDTSIGKNWADL